ncbi:MAG: 2-oxoacid:acceptor oxidoreductase family protein [Deltaproteobacteria bacterium]|nr:2-oxoacid:acceptor oxidoreductase family protein [Deltaproteobacteria bacterium]
MKTDARNDEFWRHEIRLAGSGGQGLILAGLILAEAAGLYDNREVAMVQSYGPEARGGASKAEVIISSHPIDYPLCTRVDVFLALTQEAADSYGWDLKPEAQIIVDTDLVSHPPSSRAMALPFTATARDKLKKPMVANVVALGAICELTGVVSRRSLERALLARVPAGTEALNKKALSLGVKMVRDYLGKAGEAPPREEPHLEDM